ncbi:protein of unknown function [Maridesulfovibrio hydrothermalis AM13 = DSM 14728]|uniref:Uncharacterized protein n=1 Tax=Maridesulfovibrio hydrothermalis AM13 = DSM 14728 TaxID=1121451 RepID=L0R9E6_9BACT|nr:protein of unknown function [Maridesulfovibrio hydrothermalis AM13 = DSM 14728]
MKFGLFNTYKVHDTVTERKRQKKICHLSLLNIQLRTQAESYETRKVLNIILLPETLTNLKICRKSKEG